nr:unnamed protein product [Callosobruchus analis]
MKIGKETDDPYLRPRPHWTWRRMFVEPPEPDGDGSTKASSESGWRGPSRRQRKNSLPDNEQDSDEEPDEDANEELVTLELIDSSNTSNSASTSRYITPNPSGLENGLGPVSPEVLPMLQENSEDSDVENNEVTFSWTRNCEHLREINMDFDKTSEAAPHFSRNDKEIDYFDQIFNANILDLIVEQTNLYITRPL